MSKSDEMEFRIPSAEMLRALLDKQQAVTDEIMKLTRPGRPLYLVWGDHGDYSSRTEYPVCWYPSPEDAAARVAELVALDSVWSLRCANADRFGEVHKQALSALGDPQWSPNTSYSVVEIPRGGVAS